MKQKATTKIDDLFSLRMGMTRSGDIKMEMDYVNAEVFTKTMEEHAPDFDDTWKVASLLRYLKTKGEEIMEKSNGYVA
tara:strand:- start:44 stop:277 length:234 start_codon:yes stop_codon:yes gene_type:complete